MSRHRNVRNLRLEDYIDDDDDYFEDYDDDEGQDEFQQQYLAENRTNLTFAELAAGQPETRSSEIDDAYLESIVPQFRSMLSDDTLTKTEVDQALLSADYDWEKAYNILSSRHRREARQADPSPIGALLSSDNDNPPASIVPPPLPSNSNSTPPDYHNFVADNGVAFSLSASTVSTPRFRFDRPSPDDIIRSKQARGGNRAGPPLRMPKPAAPRPATVTVTVPKRTLEKSSVPEMSVPSVPRNKSITPSIPVRQRTKNIDTTSQIKNVKGASIAVVVAGHVDAGKSTLIGQFMQQLSEEPGSRRKQVVNLAWATDNDPVEREHGVTIDITARLFQRPGDPPRTIALIDSPGHRDFVPAMIVGAVQASSALLVVDAVSGAFEAGLSELGQTREHAVVLKAFGVSSLIVVINKMDVVEFDKIRFENIRRSISDYLRSIGWKSSLVSFIPVSSRNGVNLVNGAPPGHPLCSWYPGKTLLQTLDDIASPSASTVRNFSAQPTRFIVTDFFRSASLGGQAAVSGRLLCGTLAPKDNLRVVPGGVLVSVKALSIGENTRVPVAVAGVDAVPISLSLINLPEGAVIACGSILCDPEHVAPVVTSFQARILITGAEAVLIRGAQGVLHIGSATEAAHLSKLCEYVGGKKQANRNGKKRVPRRLVRGDSAIVEITVNRGVAMEKGEVVKALSRFAFRRNGQTSAVGIVADILTTEKSTTGENGTGEVDTG